MLRTDRATNCSGDVEEWRLERTFDTRGLTDIEVCFRVAGRSATSDEGILLHASDSSHDDQVFCRNGMPITLGGSALPNEQEWPFCARLPSWAEDNPAVLLTFIAHSENAGEALFLDDVVVRGWPSTCTPTRSTLFTEDFSSCSGTTIPDGWNGWSISSTGGDPGCVNKCGSDVALVDGETTTFSHTVDTTGADTDVRLCFDVGDHWTESDAWMTVSLDAGSGWQEVWHWESDWGPDDSCTRICMSLSDVNSAVAGITGLEIRFELSTSHHLHDLYIDNVLVDGASFCPARSEASVSGLTDLGGGSYSLDLVDDAGSQMLALAHCSWDTPPEPVEDTDGTWFQSP
jgi:hypothetical protein